MNPSIAFAGNAGPDVRSDCQVQLEIRDSGGLDVTVESKVKALYGESIRETCLEVLHFFEIRHAGLKIIDNGALPFVIAARVEAAIASLVPARKEFWMPFLPGADIKTARNQFRLTRLYLPGNTPKLMLNAGIHNPDGIILDLEDSVAPEKKHEARYLVRNALRQVNFFQAERMVRINQLPAGLDDLKFIVPHHINLILVPKCETPQQIREMEEVIGQLRKIHGIDHDIWYMPIIENALGVENAFQIATASPDVVAMAIGLEDYTSDLGVSRTAEGTESFYARTRIVNACKAAGIQPIDSVYSDVGNMDGLLRNCLQSKALGFEGMGCIHPRQISVIRKGFMPAEQEIEKARKIVDAYEEARAKGLGVVSLGTKMIDAPVVKRAIAILELARQMKS